MEVGRRAPLSRKRPQADLDDSLFYYDGTGEDCVSPHPPHATKQLRQHEPTATTRDSSPDDYVAWPQYITCHDRALLLDSESWLNDAIIDTAMEMIAAQRPFCRAIASTVVKATTHSDMTSPPDLQEPDICVIMPINVAESHWVFASLDVPSRSAIIQDSMPTAATNALVKAVVRRTISKLLSLDPSQWTVKSGGGPRQNGPNDCGVFVIAASVYFVANVELPSSLDCTFWRRVILCMMPGGTDISVALKPQDAAQFDMPDYRRPGDSHSTGKVTRPEFLASYRQVQTMAEAMRREGLAIAARQHKELEGHLGNLHELARIFGLLLSDETAALPDLEADLQDVGRQLEAYNQFDDPGRTARRPSSAAKKVTDAIQEVRSELRSWKLILTRRIHSFKALRHRITLPVISSVAITAEDSLAVIQKDLVELGAEGRVMDTQ